MTEDTASKLRAATDAALTKKYVEIRDKKTALENKMKAQMAKYETALDAIENELLGRMNRQGVSSMKTRYGTPYIQSQDYAAIVDAAPFYDFVLKNQRLDMFQNRVTTKVVTEYNEDHPEAPVPGVTITTKRRVRIRKT